jgi:hypothetical protein
MAKAEIAPKDGIIRWSNGRARRVRAGGFIPAGSTFEAEEAEPKAAKSTKGKAKKETTEAAGPSETTEG